MILNGGTGGDGTEDRGGEEHTMMRPKSAKSFCNSGPLVFGDGCKARRLVTALAAMLVISAIPPGSARPIRESYDVVIVGAGTGGVSAAIQAARMGAKVALLEETDWIGGQMTAAAVSNMDEGSKEIRQSGIYREFVNRIVAHYQVRKKSVGTCYWSSSSICFEPSAGQEVLWQMIHETTAAGQVLDVHLRTKVKAVVSSGLTIQGVRTDSGRIIHSRIAIDATEYGDLIPLTPAGYRAGKGTGERQDPSCCIQDITYSAVMRKYPNGVPRALVLAAPPPGYENARALFAKVVAKEGSSWLANQQTYPVGWEAHNAYRGMPDSTSPVDYTADADQRAAISKTGVNWANDYPAVAYVQEYRPGLAVLGARYLRDEAYRKQVNCEAKLRTLQFLYYVQHELGERQWAIANDEGFDTPYNIEENGCPNIPHEFKPIERHFPVMPYVRESLRLIGLHTLTAGEIRREGSPVRARTKFPSAIAVGYYPVDLHNCAHPESLETALETDKDRPPNHPGGPFQVPFEALIPEKVDGLLVAEKNLSVTRLVNGAIRLQPIAMLTGQAAGVVAALAVRHGIQPRHVKPIAVQESLLDAGSNLSLATYSDVPYNHRFWRAVQLASLYGVMEGQARGKFGVDERLDRSEAASSIVRVIGAKAKVASDRISDATLTRGEFAEMLARAMGWDSRAASGQTNAYADVLPGLPFFEAIQYLASRRIAAACVGSLNHFCAGDAVTRGQAAAMIMEVFKQRHHDDRGSPDGGQRQSPGNKIRHPQ